MECISYYGRGIMIDIPAVKTKFDQSSNIEIGIGATVDINCNTLVSFDDDDFTGASYASIKNRQPFKLLFPVDSIVKPFRPEQCGIRYAIDGDLSSAGTYTNPRNVSYKPSNGSTYRTYYPSKNLYYKYYVTPKNNNASLSVRYYTNASPISYYNKAVPANKIVLKFELAHSTPSSFTISVNGSNVITSSTIPSSGVVNIYYNGTSWSTDESTLNYSSYVTVNTLSMTATNPGGDRHVGVIELAPHWVRDLTDRIVSMNITKEASADTKDIVPIGLITANSLDMELNSYGNANILFKTYEKDETVAIDPTYIYMVKQAEIKPYYKIYDAAGESTDSKGKYFKVSQGSFYLDTWKIGEFGELSMFALDSAKILQEIICPDMVCDKYSVIGIIRRVLDSVGFTKYNFNVFTDDKSLIAPNYWWSDSTETVWSVLQQICRDSQMSALIDENGVLQFYTRDYLFKSNLSSNWTFRNTASGADLPNIISMDMNSLPSSNNVKVLYSSTFVAAYEQSSKEIMEFDNAWLTSASLQQTLSNSADPALNNAIKHYVVLDPITIRPDEITAQETFQSFSGYILINSEIIEYDAIQFQYRNSLGNVISVDIAGPDDYAKYRGEAQVLGSGFAFWPTQNYRIKTRAALGTKKPDVPHAPSSNVTTGWWGYKDVVWK
jgi:hypothetical protein